MDIKELTALSAPDRVRELTHARERVRRLRFGASQGKLAKVREIREARATVARLMTLVRKDVAAH